MSEIDKDAAWEYFRSGFEGGRGVRSIDGITKDTAREQFEQLWKKRNE